MHEYAAIIVRRMADVATSLTVHFQGNMGQVARLTGGDRMAEHRNPALVRQHFGSKRFRDMERLM